MKFSSLFIVGLFLLLAGVAASAQASSCQVPLRNVLVAEQDCAYYETAFKMMATGKISVNAVCVKGSFGGPNGAAYPSQILTSLTVHDTSCTKMKPLELNPVLLSKPNCVNLKKVIGMLSTDFVGVDPSCNFGSWVGADGSARNSMVAIRMALRSQVAQK